MTNQFFKAPKEVQTISNKKTIALNVKGYIDLKTGIGYTSKLHYLADKAKKFAGAMVKACRLESAINDTKKAMKAGYKDFSLFASEKFALYVDFVKSCNALRSFKFSLPRTIRLNLF